MGSWLRQGKDSGSRDTSLPLSGAPEVCDNLEFYISTNLSIQTNKKQERRWKYLDVMSHRQLTDNLSIRVAELAVFRKRLAWK